jgi:hypothetical protein
MLAGGFVGVSCEMAGGADAVIGVGAVEEADTPSVSPSRRGELGGVSDDCP